MRVARNMSQTTCHFQAGMGAWPGGVALADSAGVALSDALVDDIDESSGPVSLDGLSHSRWRSATGDALPGRNGQQPRTKLRSLPASPRPPAPVGPPS